MSITGPLKRHAGISAVFAVIGIVIGGVVAYSIGAYTIPEAWGVAVANNDLVTFAGVIGVAAVAILWIMTPGLLAGKDAHDKYGQARQADKHTRQDDSQSYLDERGKAHPGALYRTMDSGPKGPGLYVQIGDRLKFVRPLTEWEARTREIENAGGFTGYNEAVNEGRR